MLRKPGWVSRRAQGGRASSGASLTFNGVDGTGLRAERVVAPSGRVGWTVVNANGVAVGPVEAFLRYRFDCEASRTRCVPTRMT